MRAFVDQDMCIGCGLCEGTCPEVFRMNDEGKAEAYADTTDALPQEEERMVLRYRYLCNMNWDEIAEEIGVNTRTLRRWHESALEHAVQP